MVLPMRTFPAFAVVLASGISLALALGACGESSSGVSIEAVATEARDTTAAAPAGGAPSGLPARRALVWAVGDGDASPAAATLVRLIARSHPDLFLYLGDVYERGTAADFARRYAPTYGRLARRTAPTPGNHEWPRAREGYFPYWKRATGRKLPGLYALEVAGWEILSLNSQTSHGAGSAQLRWLRARLRRPGTCRLAFWHRPRFSAGTVHGDQPDMAPLWQALVGRARLVIAGHEHGSQRFRRRDGITQLVAGAGGRALYPIRISDSRLAFGDASRHAALRLGLRPGGARLAFVASSGRVLDRGSVRCARLSAAR